MSAVAGLDLSLTSTGIAIAEGGSIVATHNVKSKGKKGDSLLQRTERLYAIANEVVDFVESRHPDLVVVEAPSFGSRFGSPHDRSGLWWLIVECLWSDGHPVAEVAPQGRAKYATGAGNSKKDVVLAHVIHRYQDGMKQRIGNNDDVADAVALAAMGARHLGEPVEDELPGANLAAMEAVRWPV